MSLSKKSHNLNKESSKTYVDKFNILVVDDDVEFSQMLGEILSARGHIVTVVNEGISCISKCQSFEYDLIFMDFHMGNLDGVETTDLLKKVCSTSSLFFSISGDDSPSAIAKFKEVGMNGALIKPIDVKVIEKLMCSLETRTYDNKKMYNMLRFPNIKSNLMIFK
jgi:CheY-like chemotaxis protein